MDNITAPFIQKVLGDHTWSLGNQVLYELCKNHPFHKRDDEIAAKVWLIGRSYAASIERRKEVDTDAQGDDFFYKKVIPEIQKSQIDRWIREASEENVDADEVALTTHKRVTDLFNRISGLNKRSLASKYLHFHLPKKFFLYDTRAQKAVSSLTRRFRSSGISPKHDKTYAVFVQRCRIVRASLFSETNIELNPRELDRLLLEFYKRKTLG